MPFSAGPNIAARPNLVFEYDTGDVQNSYKGEPTTNQYTNPAFTNGTTGWTFGSWDSANFTYSVENVLGPFGQVIPALKITRTGTSTYAHFHQYNSGKYTTGNQYTLSAYVIGAGTFRGNSQWGDSVNFTLSSQWQRVNYTVTAPNNSNYPYWAAEAITQNVPMYFVFAQSEQKSHVTPYIDGTRSNTQGLLDVSGQNTTIDLSNMAYTSTADLLFNGSTTEMHPTTVWSYLYSSAMECVFRTTTVSGRKMIFGYRQNDGYSQPTIGSIYLDGNTLNASVITTSQVYRTVTAAATIATNTFYHVVLNKDTSTGNLQLYVNGTLSGTQTFDAATYAQWSSVGQFIGSNLLDIGKSTNTNVGQGWSTSALSGSIPVTRIYSLTLSAQEVLRNYNQLKGRFNLI